MPARMRFDPAAARVALMPLDWRRPLAPAGALAAYARFYGLDRLVAGGRVRHGLGWIDAAGYRVAVQCWRHAEAPRGTALLLHGYYDHVGIYGHVIARLLATGHDVVAFDLPGHGLSTGEPAVIDDFDDYQQVLHAVLAGMTAAQLPPLRVAVGQSTGAAVLMEYLLANRLDAARAPFAKAVLLAPLVRPVNWTLNRLVYLLVRPFRDSIPRKFAINSHDEAFLRFLREEDPLQSHRLSVRWVGAMKRWIPRMEAHAPLDFPLVVVQGDRDGTVDWRHNLGVIRAKFPSVEVHRVAGAGHQLANEGEPWRTQVLDHMARALG